LSITFTPLNLRGVQFRNRIWVSPMCEYSSHDGMPNDWHLVHLGSRAVGGAGLVMAEATAVTADGRISAKDTGIWNDEQAKAWSRITDFIRSQGAVPGVQLAHAGRKASTEPPFAPTQGSVSEAEGGWPTLAPSAVAFEGYATPREMTLEDLRDVKASFVDAAVRAHRAGFEVIELHAAHGYLLHQFLSPLSNKRDDEYGGDFSGRTRFVLEVAEAVRAAWPDNLPMLVRLSATDWVEGGWSLDDSVELAGLLKSRGIDLVDASSGGLVRDAKIVVGPGYQVPFADAIKKKAGIPTAAVGMIDNAKQIEQILGDGSADALFIARQFLRDPYLPLHVAHELDYDIEWPVQYQRAKPLPLN
jgi:2,4-dienoyl-CoA reductase-like NADH-dependent reductase (Old Yellow Enzyme family)